jgi:LmbE family N-acetylglucosaminyl deacetylase
MEQSLFPYQATRSLGPAQVLVFAPHPDDEVFGCGGALAQHVAAGDGVQVIVATDGGAGNNTRPADYVAQRQTESQAAAAILGYAPPQFWGLADRGLQCNEALILRLLAAISQAGADLIYAPSFLEVHPDHWALSLATVEAVRRCGADIRLAFYEVAVPLHPNVLVDISAWVMHKRRAMACFHSQLQRQPYDLQIEALNRFRTYTLGQDVQAAEAFLLVSGATIRHDALAVYAKTSPLHPGVSILCAAAESQLQAMLTSRSWRMTAPLRAMYQRWQQIIG